MKGLLILFIILAAWGYVMTDDAKSLHQKPKPALPECRKKVHWDQSKGPPTVGHTCHTVT